MDQTLKLIEMCMSLNKKIECDFADLLKWGFQFNLPRKITFISLE
jgi:hypothetical protein